MNGRFERALTVILRHEGGYVDHPADPGGATNLGITHRTLAAWRGRPVTKQDVRTLTRQEAGEIYRAQYWAARGIQMLPPGVDLSVFDMAVNAGPARAVRMLQRVVGTEQDGQIGPATLRAVREIGAAAVIDAYADARLAYYRSLRHWPSFGRGWTRRTDETRAEAHAILATVAAPPAPAPSPEAPGWLAALLAALAGLLRR